VNKTKVVNRATLSSSVDPHPQTILGFFGTVSTGVSWYRLTCQKRSPTQPHATKVMESTTVHAGTFFGSSTLPYSTIKLKTPINQLSTMRPGSRVRRRRRRRCGLSKVPAKLSHHSYLLRGYMVALKSWHKFLTKPRPISLT
jgi:hypothetical protein